MSKQSDQTLALLKKMFGAESTIIEEYALDYGLRIDFFIPHISVGIEVDGIQHFQFVEAWHKDQAGFKASQRRDYKKSTMAFELGIALARVRYDETVTFDLLRERIDEAIELCPAWPMKPGEIVNQKDRVRQEAKEKRREQYLLQKERLAKWKASTP